MSDLGLFKSFPMMLLKWGIEIVLELHVDGALQNIKPVWEVKQVGADASSIYLTLPGLTKGDLSFVTLYGGVALSHYTVPDTQHLQWLKE